MMSPEVEMGGGTTAVAPDNAMPAAPAPSPAPESTPDSSEPVTQAVAAPKVSKEPTPELSLREKIQKKADEVAARRAKDPVTGKFLTKTPPPDSDPAASKTPENAAVLDPKAPKIADPTKPAAFAPNFKVKVMEQERDIPEILRPLMKDEASAKAIKEIMEKAYGLDYVKPKLEETRTQLGQVSGENHQIRGQIQNAVELFKRRDIDGWLKALGAPQEIILQWVADKLEYSKLPPEQKEILDSRRAAEERAYTAERQAGQYQQQHEQNLTQQVQMALDSVLARPDVDVVAKAYDTRTGRPGSFKAEINRRGDYIWKTTNKLTPPDQLVQELMTLVGPVAPATTPSSTAPVTPAASVVHSQSKTPVIPNISGRSASALPTKVKSIADLRAKYKEAQDAKRV